MQRDVFQAIADPTRRQILGMIAYRSLNVNSVSGHFDITRAAVYKHLKILREAGLVEIKKAGRERFCHAKMEKLEVVSSWVEQYRKLWNQKLDSLEAYLDKLQNSTGTKGENNDK